MKGNGVTGLLGPDGKPISSKSYMKKSPPPALGEKYGNWGGPNAPSFFSMPGGGAIQFNLDSLTLADFSQMKDHYQINSSLTVLMFLMHQIEWRIVCDDKKQRDFYTEQLENIWTPLVRSKSTAFWSGFSPNVLQWENDVGSRRIVLGKIKDLPPQDSLVKWKTVDGANEHKISIYDGIQAFNGKPIPVENTYWYPLLMEHGNYYGRKLLRSAFQPWFFSILVHLFANRYYERYGEPTPIGRAPYDDEIRYGGKEMRGNEAMEQLLTQLRNRSAVVLPAERTPFGDETKPEFDYQIEYLESQMRGADFERYMTRLDEEMSLALFTPILLMRTADVGSYNLGTQHSQIYLWMLNALAGDWKYYIDWYLLRPMRDYNFGVNADMPRIQFRRMGAQNEELVRDIVRALVTRDTLQPDIDQLGEIAGLDLKKVRELTDDDSGEDDGDEQPGDPTQPSQSPSRGNGDTDEDKENRRRLLGVVDSLSERIADQVRNALRQDKLPETEFSLGFQRKFEAALADAGVSKPFERTQEYYTAIETLLNDMRHIYESSEKFMSAFRSNAEWKADCLLLEK